MKRAFILFICLFTLSLTTVWARKDRVIQFSELPTTAQEFIQTHFSQEKIALAKMDPDYWDRDYEVIFVNGDKVEFDKQGNWKEVKSATSGSVPSTTIPAQIGAYLMRNYPGVPVIKVERERKKYEVKLSNGRELTFNKQFQLIDID